MSRIRIALSSALALAAACPKPARVPACASGETNRCSCASGGEGLQACRPSHDAFGDCVGAAACALGAACVGVPSLIGKDLYSAGALVDHDLLALPYAVDP